MSVDLAYRLKDYIYQLLFDNLRNEIDYQVSDVWQLHFDKILAAHVTAGNDLQSVLTKAQKTQQEFERKHERLIAVFNTFTGLALGWMAAHLQYRCATNYFRRVDYNISWSPEKLRLVLKETESEDKVAGKMFGDVVKDMSGSIIKLGMSAPKVSAKFEAPNGKAIAHAANIEEMRKMINATMIDQKNRALGAVEELANRVRSDTDMGDRILSRLPAEVPGFAQMSLSEQERRGQVALNNWLNQEREIWARSWGYYAHEPPAVDETELKKTIERELWIL